MDEKTAEVFDAINTAYADVEVQHNAELSRLLLKHRRTLENGLATEPLVNNLPRPSPNTYYFIN
ncbi:hypothetical protein JCM14202_1218 [Agrilactobacillus composti DSM 18527 = JCM 14202]|uniref:hypothetical protein n=1 Tax=Agrilactobacillus composti TaxID=398555 RepID=UPI00042DE50C|nr:hypothetical protein [Agrilactobacillus composti]GAF39360.1 hypothetical protein JCM14202_1218 [Agrilactobacillus composti DSM 18527 = JCM 14202]